MTLFQQPVNDPAARFRLFEDPAGIACVAAFYPRQRQIGLWLRPDLRGRGLAVGFLGRALWLPGADGFGGGARDDGAGPGRRGRRGGAMMRAAQVWIGRCRVRRPDEGPVHAVTLAAWAADAAGFLDEARAAAARQGWQLAGDVFPLPAADWQARHPRDDEAAALAAAGPHQRLVAGRLQAVPGPGAGSGAAAAPLRRRLIDEIGGIAPLDGQFGRWSKRGAPAALEDALFGQPDPEPAEVAQWDEGAVPPLSTYALLDAARAPLLAEMLAASGLPHRFLFKGRAAEELRAVAPYLVALDPGAEVTRRLFTRSGMPADLWNAAPGVVLRSRAGFNGMWHHLRHFTRLCDAAGDWFFLRFWDSAVLAVLGAGHLPALLAGPKGIAIEVISFAPAECRARRHRRAPDAPSVPPVPPMLSAEMIAALDVEAARYQDRNDVDKALAQLSPEDRAVAPDAERIAARSQALRGLAFADSAMRQEALALSLRANRAGQGHEAHAIVHRSGPGAGVRLWHLRRLVEGMT